MAEVEVMNRRPVSNLYICPNQKPLNQRASMSSIVGKSNQTYNPNRPTQQGTRSYGHYGNQNGSSTCNMSNRTSSPNVSCPQPQTVPIPIEQFLSEMNEIEPGLYLCGARALKPHKLRELGISCIFNVTIELPNLPIIDKEDSKSIETIKIPVEDSPFVNLGIYFEGTADRINDLLRSGSKVLVHCVAGVSRSASIIISYLMKHKKMSLRRAFQHVKNRRPIIRPNPGFFRQLIEYEKALFGNASVKMVYNAAAGGQIPDLYEPEYCATLNFMNKYGYGPGMNNNRGFRGDSRTENGAGDVFSVISKRPPWC